MDCRTARLLMDFARPQAAELEPGDRDALESHLAGCPECEGIVRNERRLDAQVGAAMCAVPVPGGLRKRIHQRLAAERNLRHRRWLRRASTVAAGIAASFLAIWFVVASQPKPTLNVPELQIAVEYRYAKTADKVEQLVRDEYDLAIVAPPQFDYSLFVAARLTHVNNRKVVVLSFAKPRQGYIDEAHVYLVPDGEFQIENPSGDSSGGRVFRSAELSGPGVHYLVFYTGENLEDFYPPAPKAPAVG